MSGSAFSNITQPNTCGVLGLLGSGGAFVTTALNDARALQASISNAASALLALPSTLTNIAMSQVQALAASLTSLAQGAINSLVSHLIGQFTNLVTNLTIAVAQSGAQSGLGDSGCGLPSGPPTETNPCGNMEALFGSIMGLGSTLINRAFSAITGIHGTITSLASGVLTDATAALNTITAGISGIANLATGITNMIAGETAALAAALSDMITFTAANQLFHLIGSPCAQTVLGSVASEALLSHLDLNGAIRGAVTPLWAYPLDAIPSTISDLALGSALDGFSIDGTIGPTLPNQPTSDTIPLAWSNPVLGTAPFSYQPQFRPSGTTAWQDYGTPTMETSVNVAGLNANTQYDFRVITSNVHGSSTSPVTTASTLSALPGAPNAATALTVGPIDTNSIALSWAAPSSGVGPFQYQVRLRSAGAYFWNDFGPVLNTPSTVIAGLGTASRYEIQIVTLNSISSSRSAVITIGTTNFVPNQTIVPTPVPTSQPTPLPTPVPTLVPTPPTPVALPLGAYVGDPDNTNPTAQAAFEAQYQSFKTAMGRDPTLMLANIDPTLPPASWASVSADHIVASWRATTFLQPGMMQPVIGLPMYSSGVLVPTQPTPTVPTIAPTPTPLPVPTVLPTTLPTPTVPTVAPTPGGRGLPGDKGFSYHALASATEDAAALDAMAAAGAQWVRFDLDWGKIQPNGPAVYDWTFFDVLISGIVNRGMKPLAVLTGTPNWAVTQAPYSAPDPVMFAAFVSAAVQRYSRFNLHNYEIYNEPNLDGFYPPASAADQYGRVLQAGYQAIKAVDPTAFVITAGLSPISVSDGLNIADTDFLSALYAGGFAPFFDGVGAHPYSWPLLPESFASNNGWSRMTATTPDNLRSIMIANGDANKPIWITEYGAPTNGAVSQSPVSEQFQAQLLSAGYQLAQTYPWAGPMFWYQFTDQDTANDPNNMEDFFGIVRFDGSHKPSFAAFQAVTALGVPTPTVPTVPVPTVPVPTPVPTPTPLPTPPTPTVPTPVLPPQLPDGPFSTAGSQIVSSNGTPVRVVSVGWRGADSRNRAPIGLDTVNYQTLLRQVLVAGFNCVRIATADAAILNNDSVTNVNTTLNPDLAGKNLNQILTTIVDYCGTIGIKVIIDSHNNEGKGGTQGNGLWYDVGGSSAGVDGSGNTGTISDATFLQVWRTRATLFKGRPALLGYDLRNAPMSQTGQCTWGDGGTNDLRAMYQRVGNAIQLIDATPLIICAGPLNYNGNFAKTATAPSGDLSIAQQYPVVLSTLNKVVYSVQEYPNTVTQSAAPDNGSAYVARMQQNWGYLVSANTAPVFVGECGTSLQDTSEQAWATTFIAFINGVTGGPIFSGQQQGISFSWSDLEPINGTGAGKFGILTNWSGTIDARQKTYWGNALYTAQPRVPTTLPTPTPVPTPTPTPVPTPTPTTPTPTPTSISLASFGAIGDGVTDNRLAIQSAFDHAAAIGAAVSIPPGTFAYSGVISANGISVVGADTASILKPTDPTNSALELTGSGGSISHIAMVGSGSIRQFQYQGAMIWINAASNFTISHVTISGSAGVGIFNSGGQNGMIVSNTVKNTLADAITNTDGASHITVKANLIQYSGDDGISNNSYSNNPQPVNNIMVKGNTVLNNIGGRGLEVSGGNTITFTGNYVDNSNGYSDMYVASEGEFSTQSVSNITITGNTFMNGGPNQGSLIIYNSMPGATISGVTITGNQFVNPKLAAVQITGSGSVTGVVIQNNTDYSNLSFSTVDNTAASASISNNPVLPSASFSTPLVTPGFGAGSPPTPTPTAPTPVPTPTPTKPTPPTPTPVPTPTPTKPTPTPTASFPSHVVVCIMENHDYSDIVGSSQAPYINSLITQGCLFTNYDAVSHPSEPNYFALFTGSDQGITDDGNYYYPNVTTLCGQLLSAGKSFVGYAESGSPQKHNPWQSFGDSKSSGSDFSQFPSNYNNLPTVSFVVPDLNDDMHDGTISQGDTWLQNNLDAYVQWCKTNNSLFVLVFDENESGASSNQVLCLIVGQTVGAGTTNNTNLTHYSLLRMIEDFYGLPRLANAASATAIVLPS